MNATKFTFIVIFLSACSQVFSQDLIYKRNGTKDSVIIQDTTGNEVTYKLYNKSPENIYKLSKAEIILIEFYDGKIMLVGSGGANTRHSLGRNLISINTFSILFNNVHINYERILKKPKYSLRLVFNTNTGIHTSNNIGHDRLLAGGIDFNYYPKKQRKISYYLGPGIRAGRLRDPYYDIVKNIPEHYTYAGLYMNIGINIRITRLLFFGVQGGIGLAGYMPVEKVKGYESAHSDLDGLCYLNFGCRF